MLKLENIWLSAAILLLSGITDIVDGWIARHFNMITDIGKIYDPFVDKLMQITAVVCLAAIRIIPVWVIFFIIFKEVTMIITGLVLYMNKIVVHSNWYGKCATVFFYAVIFAMILIPQMSRTVKTALLISLVLVVVLAAVGYLLKIIDPKEGEVYEKKLD